MLRGCAVQTDTVLLDTSVFVRAMEVGQLLHLPMYLKDRLRIVDVVACEIDRLTRSGPKYRGLQILQSLPAFREDDHLALPDEIWTELLSLAKIARKPNEPETQNLGEVTTALMARHMRRDGREDVLVIMDDRLGKALLKEFDVPQLHTGFLAAEMVIHGAIPDSDGFRLFDISTPIQVGRRDWKRAKSLAERLCAAAADPVGDDLSGPVHPF